MEANAGMEPSNWSVYNIFLSKHTADAAMCRRRIRRMRERKLYIAIMALAVCATTVVMPEPIK